TCSPIRKGLSAGVGIRTDHASPVGDSLLGETPEGETAPTDQAVARFTVDRPLDLSTSAHTAAASRTTAPAAATARSSVLSPARAAATPVSPQAMTNA